MGFPGSGLVSGLWDANGFLGPDILGVFLAPGRPIREDEEALE